MFSHSRIDYGAIVIFEVAGLAGLEDFLDCLALAKRQAGPLDNEDQLLIERFIPHDMTITALTICGLIIRFGKFLFEYGVIRI